MSEGGDSLAHMDHQIRRRRTLEAIKRILLRESLNQPLMVIFEDLHWIDPETQTLLNLLVDAIAHARILLLVNYRPEYRHEWGSQTHYMQLGLDSLGRESAEQMLDALLTSPVPATFSTGANEEGSLADIHVGDRARMQDDLAALKHQIIDQTDGTPFFMEEMVQSLFEEGALQRDEIVHLTQPINAIKVPATVQAVHASRIDRLAAPEKELLQTLAVLGREFSLSLAQRVTLNSTDDLEQTLSHLQLGEFIYEQSTVGEVKYSFKHALTQEVAYNSLLAERRRAFHEQIGHAIEELYAHQLEDRYSDLARHYLRGSNMVKALRYAQLAADQAVARGAFSEAASTIEAVLKPLERLPKDTELMRNELSLRSIQTMVERALHGRAENDRVIRRMCELGEKIGEKEELLRALLALSTLHFTRGEIARGLEVAQRCICLAESVQDARLQADTYWRAGILAQHFGSLREAITHIEDAMRRSGHVSRAFRRSGFRSGLSFPRVWLRPSSSSGRATGLSN